MELYTVDQLAGRAIKEGEMLHATSVLAANFLRDAREMVQNAIGGKMRRYERLLDRVTSEAMDALKDKAAQKGYHGLVAVRISNPFMIEGSAAVTVYGTPFHFVEKVTSIAGADAANI